jgi:hypothetical protein
MAPEQVPNVIELTKKNLAPVGNRTPAVVLDACTITQFTKQQRMLAKHAGMRMLLQTEAHLAVYVK